MPPKALTLILGDQLFPHTPGSADAPIFMREDWILCTEPKIHKQKIAFFLSAMRHHRDALIAQEKKVHYQILQTPDQDPRSYPQALADFCKANQIQTVHTYEIHDQPFAAELKNHLAQNQIQLQTQPSPAFLTPRADWQTYREESKRLLMADFYTRQRKRLRIMVDENEKPEGGQWSYDPDNRKPFPKGKTPPHVPRFPPDPLTQEVLRLVQSHFPDHPGNLDAFDWPVTRADALAELDTFLQDRLPNFGPYEDAVSRHHEILYHSLLSPLLNCGLLTPQEVIDRLLQNHADAPLASREGFVRQIIGWREFIYGLSRDEPWLAAHRQNTNNHQRRLTHHWYDGTTGLLPLDDTIRKLQNRAWCHHIPRLMIVGSAMLMAEIHPDDVYRWFMEMFIDSADWVMLPNVYGMSQFADGGLFATKPYISGSAYLRRMTDYPPGPWCETWDGLYWRFLERHQPHLSQNPRMTIPLRQLDKLEPNRKSKILSLAQDFIDQLTTD